MIQRTFLQQLTEEGSKTMRVLAIDSSGLTATVAVVEDEQTIAEYTVNYKKTHSQTLLPMMIKVSFANNGLSMEQAFENLLLNV